MLQAGAISTVRTATQQMTVLHVLFLLGKKSADDALATTKMLLDHGLRELINEPDSLGNTPLHALIVRCVQKCHLLRCLKTTVDMVWLYH